MIRDVLDWPHRLARAARLVMVASVMIASLIVAGPLGSPRLALADPACDGALLQRAASARLPLRGCHRRRAMSARMNRRVKSHWQDATLDV
ncbi:hypothetical protein SAMN04488115_10673 [Bosea lathyri]|uniref:Uncharacterized protein n=1 Tax=Bosea lathyri TaxID=1036778 RepID=A0A1H6AR89_9HYPH|nr:hypothetical protein SAMN04488115_10673 [Bosea lathyri]